MRQRGFALLIVLWSLALLALIGTRLTSAGRTEARIAINLRANATAEALADGAVHEAIFHFIDRSDRHWSADGLPRTLNVPGASVDVRIVPQGGMINPNLATAPLVAALLRQLGVQPREAASIAAAIFDWRTEGALASPLGAKAAQYRAAGRDYGPPGKPFESLDELSAVLGMNPALLAAVRPYLSLYNFGPVDPRLAGPMVLRALADSGVGQPPGDDVGTILVVIAAVTLVDGTSFIRRATLRLVPRGMPYQMLAWESVVL